MTLNTFERLFPANRLKNGLTYFKHGKVSNLEEDSDGDWTATVTGTDKYEVQIIMDEDFIDETDCTCESYDDLKLCKHVAAVLYAIKNEKTERDKKAVTIDEAGVTPEVKNAAIGLLDKLTHEELRAIIAAELGTDKKFAETFSATANHFLLCRDAIQLQDEFWDKMETLSENGIIPKKNVPAVIEVAESYLAKATTYWQQNDIKKAFDYLSALTEGLTDELDSLDDDEGLHRDVMGRAIKLIDRICSSGELSENLLEILSLYAFKLAADPNLPIAYYETHWLDILIRHNLAEYMEDELLDILDQQIKKQKTKGTKETALRLLNLKISFLDSIGRKKEAKLLISEGTKSFKKAVNAKPSAPKKAKAPVDISKKKEENRIAKENLLAKLEAARSSGDPQQYASLQKETIELLQSQSDVLGVRKYAEQFYRETGESAFFEAIKDTYTQADWQNVKHTFITPGNPLRRV